MSALPNLYFDCWRCGRPVLLVAGYTFKQDPQGSYVMVCPWCSDMSSAKTIVGRVGR